MELEARTEDPGTTLRAPTLESGLAPACKDTCFGDLKLQIWERKSDGSKGKVTLFWLTFRIFSIMRFDSCEKCNLVSIPASTNC